MPDCRALFLDRDGTINVDKHYVHRPQDFEWIPGIVELCRAAQAAGYIIIIITNQSGIERGYYTEQDYAHFMRFLSEQFAAQGVHITGDLHCPRLHDDKERKPAPGLFLQAARKWGINMAASLSLGDKERDVQAGRHAGVGRNYLLASETDCPLADAVVANPRDLIPFL